MSRVFSSGFEQNTITSAVEWASTTGTPSIVSTTVRSGSYSLQITGLASGTRMGELHSFRVDATGKGPYYGRVYLNIATLPSAENRIISFQNGANFTNTNQLYITLLADGTLKLYDSVGVVGSASSALSLNTWYRIEFLWDKNPANGSQVISAQIDGSVFASASNRTFGNTVQSIIVGGNLATEAQTTGSWFFDDIAVNDTTATTPDTQSSYPGSGKIIHRSPNAAGDANTFATQTGGTSGAANNYTRVNELTPDDVTSFNGSNTLNQEDLFNVLDPSIGPLATVNLVQVGVRFRNNVADATTAMKVELEKASAGTVLQSAAIVPNSTTWVSNGIVVPRAYPIIAYVDPDGSAWTEATVISSQIGYKITTGGTNRIDVSNVWMLIEFVASAPVTSRINNSGSLNNLGGLNGLFLNRII